MDAKGGARAEGAAWGVWVAGRDDVLEAARVEAWALARAQAEGVARVRARRWTKVFVQVLAYLSHLSGHNVWRESPKGAHRHRWPSAVSSLVRLGSTVQAVGGCSIRKCRRRGPVPVSLYRRP